MSDRARWLWAAVGGFVWFAAAQVGTAHAGQLAYVVAHDFAGNGPDLFGTVDVTTGTFHQISTLSTGDFSIFGMGLGPNGLLYGTAFNLANFQGSGEFFSINPATGATNDLGALAFNPAGAGNFATGPLFALGFAPTTAPLYSMSPPSNSSTLIGTLPFASDGMVAVDSRANLFTSGNGDGSFYRVNTSDASSTLIGNTGLGLTLFAGTFVGDTLYGFSAGQGNDTIYTISTTDASVTKGAEITLPANYDVVAAAAFVPEPGTIVLGIAAALCAFPFIVLARKPASRNRFSSTNRR
jgi:hypothetical protein